MLVVIDYGAFEIASSNVCLKGFVDLKKYVGSVLALDACESWSARARRRRSIGSWKRCRLVAVVVEVRHRGAEPRLGLGSRSVSHIGDSGGDELDSESDVVCFG